MIFKGNKFRTLKLIFIILCFLEIFIRGNEAVSQINIDNYRGRSKGIYTILCVGDSSVYGVGANAGKAYPDQLEELLISAVNDKKFRVVNKGVPAQNTRQLLEGINYYINSEKPDLVIILSGEANYWNYTGYEIYSKEKALFPILKNIFSRIRIYRLTKNLYFRIISRVKNPDNSSNKGNYNGTGVSYFEQGIKVNPKDINNYNGIGYVYLKEGRYNEAIKWFEEAISINPKDYIGCNGLGWAYTKQGRHEDAVDRFKEGISLAPRYSGNYNGIGEIYKELGKYDEAEKWFKEAININPKDSNHYSGLGWLYVDQVRYTEAIKCFETAMSLNPNNPDSYKGMGILYLLRFKFEEASEWFKEGIRMNPVYIGNYHGLGQAYQGLGKYEEAIKCFKKEIAIAPEDTSSYSCLFLAYKAMGRHVEAVNLFKKGKKLNLSNKSNYKKNLLVDRKPDLCSKYLYMMPWRKRSINSDIGQWAESDLEKIINICKENKIAVVLQDYPKGNREIISIIKRLSEKHAIAFVENSYVFNNLSGNGEEKYFTSGRAYCNDMGYGVMAKNIYNKIIECNSPVGNEKN